ncbi:hypothetical protein B879_03486 [Cecembia lonarensis LW9]|uniref:Uncharacterized protein n=1 Tax=Cecembia lonarensis (strain CCUG 58316 / KCTC 22772 / LW9) TaxID=1225176 RepID=K1LC15_CECL9|nr:hypothetical protein B879_03486 [Cecembia lonarensis LW9]
MVGLGDWFYMGIRIVPEAQPIVSKKAVTIPLRPVGTADAVGLANVNKAKGERMMSEK